MFENSLQQDAEESLKSLKVALWRSQRESAIKRNRRGFDLASRGLECVALIERLLSEEAASVEPRRANGCSPKLGERASLGDRTLESDEIAPSNLGALTKPLGKLGKLGSHMGFVRAS